MRKGEERPCDHGKSVNKRAHPNTNFWLVSWKVFKQRCGEGEKQEGTKGGNKQTIMFETSKPSKQQLMKPPVNIWCSKFCGTAEEM
jgi:hypothetical protein